MYCEHTSIISEIPCTDCNWSAVNNIALRRQIAFDEKTIVKCNVKFCVIIFSNLKDGIEGVSKLSRMG